MRPPKTIENSGLGESSHPAELVSGGLEWPPESHKFDTNDTNLTQGRCLDPVSRALEMTSGLGTRECIKFRKNVFNRFEPICLTLASGYGRIAQEAGYVKANLSLLHLESKLMVHDINLTDDTQSLKDAAEFLASQIAKARVSQSDAKALRAGRRLANLYGIEIPKPSDYHNLLSPVLERLVDPKWWLRKIRRLQKLRIDEVARDLRTVNQQASPYVSTWGLINRRREKVLSDEYLSSTIICNDQGEHFSLKEIADRNVSNPTIRRAELMARAKGFELVAQELGHVAEFYTITTPSRMHAQLKSGKRNPAYGGTSVSEAQTYLNHLWQCARAKLHREGIYVYGFRVVEPHHDGTPHWHLLLFMEPDCRDRVRSILKHYSLKSDSSEPGAAKQRFKAIAIDYSKGTAAGYIAKYIAKNIDGAHLEQDLYGNNAAASAERIEAWASLHSIRQFQQIGGPSVTTWRELRRLNKQSSESVSDFFTPADAGDWAAYVMVMGGPSLKRCQRPLLPYYEQQPIALPTGELNPDAVTKYGDYKTPVIKGLKQGMRIVITRPNRWHVLKMTPA